MKKKLYISLKYKLVFILTALPLVSLGTYLVMATGLFERDKLAYVFDSSVAVSRFLSNQVRTEVDLFLTISKPLIEQYYENSALLSQPEETGGAALQKNVSLLESQDRLLAFRLVDRDSNRRMGEDRYEIIFKSNLQAPERALFANAFNQNKSSILNGDLKLIMLDDEGLFLISKKVQGDRQDRFVVGLYRSRTLRESFNDSKIYNSFLLDQKLQVMISPFSVEQTDFLGLTFAELFSPASLSQAPEGTAELVSQSGERALVSFARLGDLSVVSVVDRKEALKAVDMMLAKSLLFFLALLAGTVVVSIFASSRLTSSLRELYQATQKIAQGDFNVNVKASSQDEVGGLAESFNWMALEVSRLLSETAEKARMESELATVKTVQETLFPESEGQHGDFSIAGLFEPASECGGDWWNYSRIGDKLYLWIGDATGHGAPAALITSAARSAAAIVESFEELGPAEALEIMNRAIFATAKGKIMMTFFLGVIDIKSGQMVYANASHDPPYFVRTKGKTKVTKKDLVPLMETVGPRLGDRAVAKYVNINLQLEPEDLLVLYTDGIIDLSSPDGQVWGERTFLKNLTQAISQENKAKMRLNHLKLAIDEFRQGSALDDDITLFICQYEKAS